MSETREVAVADGEHEGWVYCGDCGVWHYADECPISEGRSTGDAD